jgi:hypothetical protein
MADDTGSAPKELVIETLCSWPDGLAVGGFRVSPSIPRVRFRRGGPLDRESRRRRQSDYNTNTPLNSPIINASLSALQIHPYAR